ncbi:MAG: hypothetical protein AABX73_04120 [Nanoarchaeota archaeon]
MTQNKDQFEISIIVCPNCEKKDKLIALVNTREKSPIFRLELDVVGFSRFSPNPYQTPPFKV